MLLVFVELYVCVCVVEWCRSEFLIDERIKIGDLVIDRVVHEVSVQGVGIALTVCEFVFLCYFVERCGRVVSCDELFEYVWGDDYDGGFWIIDIHVRRLRAKLGLVFDLVIFCGVGYCLGGLKWSDVERVGRGEL